MRARACEVGPQGSLNPVDLVLKSRQRGSTRGGVTCTGAHVVLKAQIITTTIPQSCFRRVTGAGAGAVEVGATTTGNVGAVGAADYTVTTPWVHKAKKEQPSIRAGSVSWARPCDERSGYVTLAS